MNTIFEIKQHDLLPRFDFTLLDFDEPADLSYALSARFMMRNRSTGLKVDRNAVILDQSVDANVGKGYYEWVEGDTDTVGSFKAEIEVIWADGRPQTFPGNKYVTIKILKDLDTPRASGSGSIATVTSIG